MSKYIYLPIGLWDIYWGFKMANYGTVLTIVLGFIAIALGCMFINWWVKDLSDKK